MGEITLLVEADLSPIAVGNFVALAECGFYNNVIFHRIAYMQDGTPFVIQGGDPHGHGGGNAGWMLPDEISSEPYERGVLGMPKSTKDDGGCQLFFMMSPYARLDGNYTLYDDDGNSLDYLKGDSVQTLIKWDDAAKTLSLEPASKQTTERTFRIEFIPDGVAKEIHYSGQRVELNAKWAK